MRKFFSKYGFTSAIIVVLILAGALLMSSVSFNNLINRNQDKIIDALTKLVRSELNVDLSIDGLTAEFPFSVSLNNISMRDSNGNPLLQIESAIIKADWLQIINKPDMAVNAIRYIQINKPVVKLVVSDGSVNWMEVFKTRKERKVKFPWHDINMKIILNDARAEVVQITDNDDGTQNSPSYFLPVFLSGNILLIDGDIVLHPKLKVYWMSDNHSRKLVFQPERIKTPVIEINGMGNLSDEIQFGGKINLSGIRQFMDLLHLTSPEFMNMDIASDEIVGDFKFAISNMASGDPEFSFDIEMDASRARFTLPNNKNEIVEFSKFFARFSLPSNICQISVDGNYGGSSFDALFQIDDFKTTEIKGLLHARDISMDLLIPDSFAFQPDMQGTINVDAQIGGTLLDIVASGQLWSDNLKLSSRDFKIDKCDFDYGNEKVSIPSLSLTTQNDGYMDLSGEIMPFGRTGAFDINSDNIEIDFFQEFFKFNIPFNITGKPLFDAALTIEDNTFKAKLNVNIPNSSVINVPCSNIHGGVIVDNEKVVINHVLVEPENGGVVAVDGEILRTNTINLELEMNEIKLDDIEFVDFDMPFDIKGTVFGSGKIEGDLSNPVATLSLRAYNGRILNWPFERGDFTAVVDSSGLKESYTKLTATGSEIEMYAEYLFKHDRPLVMWGKWKNVPLPTLSPDSFVSKMMISGNGEFIGDADSLNGILNLSIDGDDGFANRIYTPDDNIFTGTFLDIDITGIGKFDSVGELSKQLSEYRETFRESGVINSGTLQSGALESGTLEVSGAVLFESLAEQSELSNLLETLKKDILPSLPGIDLQLPSREENSKVIVPLDGLMALDLSIERKKRNWLLEGSAECKDFKINSENIHKLNAKINTLPDGNYNTTLNFTQGEGNISVSGIASLAEFTGVSPMNLDMKIVSYPLNSLARLVGIESEDYFDGLIEGRGKLKGSFLDMKLEDVDLFFRSAKLFGIPVDDSNLKFSWEGTRIDGLSFELKDDEGFHAVARGSIELEPSRMSESYISMSIDNLPLENLSKGGLIPEGMKGRITSLVLQLSYDPNTSEPKIYMDIKADNPGYKWFNVDKIIAQGFVDGMTGEFKLGRLQCTLDDSIFEMSGMIIPSLNKNETRLDLNITASDFDLLPIMRQLGISLKGEKTSLDIIINLGGTSEKPLLNGNVEAVIKKPLLDKITIADSALISLEIKDNAVDLIGTIESEESILTCSGEFDLNQFSSFSNGRIKRGNEFAPRIEIANLNDIPFPFNNFGLDVDILLRGKNNEKGIQLDFFENKAKLSGIIEIVTGSYLVSPIPITASTEKGNPVEIDIEVIIPDGFAVSSGNTLDIRLDKSSLDISGTPGDPSAIGEITVQDGRMRLLDRTFTINEATLQFKEFLGIDNPYLRGQASTVIISRSIRNLQGTENLLVTARINANLRQLNKGLTFTSDRGTLSENDLMGIIMRQDLFQDFQDEGILTTLSQQAFTIPGAYISRFFESQGGFQLFQVGVDFENDIYVNLEYETFKDFFLDYYHLFSNTPEYDVYLKYRIRKDSYIGLGIDENDSIIIKLDYNIPLK